MKTTREIEELAEGGRRLGQVLEAVADAVKIGVTTSKLNQIAEEKIHELGGVPSFKGYRGFPAGLCTSINEEVVHGIPSDQRVLADGDILGLDIGMVYRGLFTDMAITVGVGTVSTAKRDLMTRTREALLRGISLAKPGNTLGDIAHAIQQYCESFGYGVIRNLVGHGVGYAVHEPPQIPNFGIAGQGLALEQGMVLALEPMISLGSYEIQTLQDGWTVVTKDGSPAAHFEHTIVVLESGPKILTPLPWEKS